MFCAKNTNANKPPPKPPNVDFDADPKLRQIRHDIKNLKRLTPQQKEYIRTISDANKLYIIGLYDHMLEWFIHFVDSYQ